MQASHLQHSGELLACQLPISLSSKKTLQVVHQLQQRQAKPLLVQQTPLKQLQLINQLRK